MDSIKLHMEGLGAERTVFSGLTLPVMGFVALGAFSFGLVSVILLLQPHALSGNPVRGSVLALTHLVTLGWIASVLFAGAYLFGPILAGSPLWSARLPVFHLLCHVTGLTLMLGGLSVLRYELVSLGGGIVCLGLLALILNLLVTASKRSLWTPSNLGFQAAMFWLAVTGGIALFMLRGRLTGEQTVSPETLIALHANGALFGFLAQALLSISLKVVPRLLELDKTPAWLNRFGWTGWVFLNAGLLLFPMIRSESRTAVLIIGLFIAIGGAGFAAQIVSYYFLRGARWSWASITHLSGILLLGLIVAGALWQFPLAEDASVELLRSWIRLYISLALLGPFAFVILGSGMRFAPELIWRLRFVPWARYARIPGPSALSRAGASGPVFFSLAMAWVYLYMGQMRDDATSIRLGAILLLVAFIWFLIGVSPALLSLALGVTPHDLDGLREPSDDLQASPPHELTAGNTTGVQ